MKRFRNRVVYLVIVVWGLFFSHQVYRAFIKDVTLGRVTSKDFVFFLVMLVGFVVFLVSSLIIEKRKSGLPLKLFLKEHIDVLDEDERAYQIDASVRRSTASILLMATIIIWVILESWLHINVFTNADLLFLMAVLFTIYQLLTYHSIKKVYESDEQSLVLKHSFIKSVCIAIITIGLFVGWQRIQNIESDHQKNNVTIVGFTQTAGSSVSFGPIEGQLDSKTQSIVVSQDNYRILNRILNLDIDSLRVFNGTIDAYQKAREDHVYTKNMDPDLFYLGLSPVSVVFNDFDMGIVILVVE
ncbi:hypothetical protein AOC36_01255 [Erysipelothrix larvae]|uniref:Uncharacterized protein n=1 Tax=Erysipelothrix larvae TaxID=1514105 RepID=A0A0X8GYA7_9FIRM|nr:hypothetical protein [Erysipelothrix larvae]AMC92666.1 hypothetical protein AOC36_01255 [Erysipelothrix larvae]